MNDSTELRLRVARESDLPQIVSIYNSTIPSRVVTADLEPVTVESRRDWFRSHSAERHPLWVLESRQTREIAGWLSYSKFYGRPAYSGTAEISVYVHENWRRRGCGRLLLEAAITYAPVLGLHTLLGFIFGHNDPSLELFSRHGFNRWALLPRVAQLDSDERDLIILGLRIDPTETLPGITRPFTTLRSASAADLPSLRELLASAELPTEDLTEKHLDHYIVVVSGQTIVATVGLEVHGQYGLLRSLAVAPSYRGLGLSLRLISLIEAYARKHNLKALYLLTITADQIFSRCSYKTIPRKLAPQDIQDSAEFSSICPSNSVCMMKTLG
ncbi:MAG: arsenic resistance N-acetyltransferase ArsN2 [Verrucomicrobiota bacterium]|nr:arsenic resistance N-acetyltransferase ArsN2 [Verrucomicrobiota bacterium]